MPTIYGDASTYGDIAALYGIISTELAVAQALQVRETGLKVTIVNERTNAWEYFAGASVNGIDLWRPIQFTGGARKPIHQDYWSYRGSASSVKLTGGDIIRIRNTDGTEASRIIQIQTITDPTVVSQWTSWSTLYSGTHYACCIVPNGASFDIYHCKSDGLYKNNSLVWAQTGLISVKAVQGQPKAVFVMRVIEDPVDGDGRYRDLNLYYTPNIDTTDPEPDPTNYRWSRNYIHGFQLTDGRVARIQSNSWYFNPRIGDQGNAIMLQFMEDFETNEPSPPRLIRGVGGGSGGKNYCVYPFIRLLSDGFYYLYYTEIHEDSSFDFVTNLYGSLFWQRSKDLRFWSEPTAVGFNGWDFNDTIEHSDYIWLVDNGSVWRRPMAALNLEISNYVPELDFSIPRDNQTGGGKAVVANPLGVNDPIIDLGDREVKIELGIKTEVGLYEYREFNKWFVTAPTREVDPITGANRIQLPFGDLWTRLSNPLRDTYNLVGKLEWRDWAAGCRNRAFNYFFVTDTVPVENELIDGPNGSDIVIAPYTLTSKGVVLYTGWKGHNGTVEGTLSDVTVGAALPSLIYRYVDADNYYRIEDTGGGIDLIRRRAGVEDILDSGSGSIGTCRVEFRWSRHRVYQGSTLAIEHFELVPGSKPGYTGFNFSDGATLSSFSLDDFEDVITTEDLARLALAFGNFHDAIVSGGETRELGITWGPQTDIPTPADALLQALIAQKLQLIWRNGSVEIGKFTDNTVKKIVQDRIIDTDYIDDANRRINFAAVDGNEHSWLQFDAADIRKRDRQINAYFDLPELTDQDSVRVRAEEEILRSSVGRSPGGKVVLFYDLDRMDVITWIDAQGLSADVKIEGIEVQVNQSTKPRQDESFDTSLLDSTSTPLVGVDAGTPA